jgi:hypothetical protein
MIVQDLIEKLQAISNGEQEVVIRLYKGIPQNTLSPLNIVYENDGRVELIADDLNTF